MVPRQKHFNFACHLGNLLWLVFVPPQALFADRAIETLDMGLFILLVGARNAVSVTISTHGLSELGTTVGLDEGRPALETTGHTPLEKCCTIFGRQTEPDQDICFSAKDVYRSESEYAAEIYSIL